MIEIVRRRSIGLTLLSIFFLFGALMCLLTVIALIFPGGLFDPLWHLNPDAHRAFQRIGGWAILLMALVGTACLLSAIGLATRAPWGRQLAVGVLAVNLVGDAVSAVVRHDLRTLIGLPIGGAMILYLLSRRVARYFEASQR